MILQLNKEFGEDWARLTKDLLFRKEVCKDVLWRLGVTNATRDDRDDGRLIVLVHELNSASLSLQAAAALVAFSLELPVKPLKLLMTQSFPTHPHHSLIHLNLMTTLWISPADILMMWTYLRARNPSRSRVTALSSSPLNITK